MGKKQVMTSIDEEIHTKAKEKGLNISEELEKALTTILYTTPVENVDVDGLKFEFEEVSMGEQKKKIFISAIIKARNCKKCGETFFVNDMYKEWDICRRCRGIGFEDWGIK